MKRLVMGLLALGFLSAASAQVATGLLDLNTASAEQLATLPNMSAKLVQSVVDRRPFANIVDADQHLRANGMTSEQTAALYALAFIHADLNRASEDEFLLIPGAGPKMAHEFEEYRPWKSWAQFDREIGKYVGADETNRFKQYMYIPLDLNNASNEAFRTIPGVGRRMAHEFEEYRPWKSEKQFRKEIGKYVDEAEVARLWRYVSIP